MLRFSERKKYNFPIPQHTVLQMGHKGSCPLMDIRVNSKQACDLRMWIL